MEDPESVTHHAAEEMSKHRLGGQRPGHPKTSAARRERSGRLGCPSALSSGHRKEVRLSLVAGGPWPAEAPEWQQ